MDFRKSVGLLALITPLWFLAVYLIMSSLRPEYRHLSDAISQLGTLDAPNLWTWNVLGYILPGLAIACLGMAMKQEFPAAKVATFALVASGLSLALSGAFPGDLARLDSTTTTLHLLASQGCFLGFLTAGFLLPRHFRKDIRWRWVAWPSLALVVASMPTVLLRASPMPGLGQRLTFACFFFWIALLGSALMRASTRASAESRLYPGNKTHVSLPPG